MFQLLKFYVNKLICWCFVSSGNIRIMSQKLFGWVGLNWGVQDLYWVTFKKFECFNRVLLAKQGWHLIQMLNTLVVQIFNEKYYPWDNFLDSILGHRSSYAWRSIWHANDLLKARLVWHVGDGSSIIIWEDKWLLNPSTLTMQSSVMRLDKNERVKGTHWRRY